MKVIDKINNNKSLAFSYELLPPIKGSHINQIIDIVTQIKPYNPAWINVTSHASSLIYDNNSKGQISQKIYKKRPGTLSVCGVIQNKFGIDAVAHMLCLGFSKEETENALIELSYLGVENILALRGDSPNYDKFISKNYSVNTKAHELTSQVINMRHGKFLENTEYTPIDFCIGVAGYPEKHIDAANVDVDILHLQHKVLCGAEYIVTQMFFDNKKYYDFVTKCRNADIHVPIIPGIKILKNAKQLETIPKLFNIELPNPLVNEIMRHPDDAALIGKRWAKEQIQDLIKNGVNNIHLFLMNDVSNVLEIIDSL